MPSPSTHRIRIEFFKELYECCVVAEERGDDGKLSETCRALIRKHPDLVLLDGDAKCPPQGFQIEERRFVRGGFTTRYKTITRWCGLTATECMCEEVQQDDGCGGGGGVCTTAARDLLLQLIEAGAPITDKCYNLGAKTTDGVTNIYIVEALLAGGYVPLQQRQRQPQSSDGDLRTYFFLDGMVESVGNGDWDFDDEDDLEALACDELHGILKILNKQIKVGDPCSFGRYSQTVVHNVKTRLPKLKPSVPGVWSSMCSGGVTTHSPDGPFAAVQETWLRLNGLTKSMSNVEESEDDSDNDSNSSDNDSDSDNDSIDQEEDEVELEEVAVENADRGESIVEEHKEDDAIEEEVVSSSNGGDDDDEEEVGDDNRDSDYDERKRQKVVVRKVARRSSNNGRDRDSGKSGTSAIENVGHKRKRNSEEDEGEEEQEREETRCSHNDDDDDCKKHAALAGTTTTTTSNNNNTSDNTNANNDSGSTTTTANAANDDQETNRNKIDGNTTTTTTTNNNNNNNISSSSSSRTKSNENTDADASTNSSANDNADRSNNNNNNKKNSNNTDYYGNAGFFPAGCAVNFPKNEHWNSAKLAYGVTATDVTACVRHNNGTVERMPRRDIEIVPIDSGRPSRRRRRR